MVFRIHDKGRPGYLNCSIMAAVTGATEKSQENRQTHDWLRRSLCKISGILA